MKKVKSARLTFTEASSDKEYQLHLVEDNKLFIVNFEYGRRNGTLKSGTKTKSPVSQDEAEKIFDKILKEKTSEGYVLDGEAVKTLSVYYMDDPCEAQLFFNGDECIGAVSANDGDWRGAYFNPIMKVMGLKVVNIKKINEKQLSSAKKEYPKFFEEYD